MNRKLQKECESGIEYVLPDYMGDIKKLLSCKARAMPTGKFVGDGSVEVSGCVDYDLLYLDAEGKLTAVNASSDFTENFVTDTETYIDSLEEGRVTSLKVRVTGPRKISMKAEVETRLTVCCENEIKVSGDVFDEEGDAVEKRFSEVTYATSIFAKSGEREYAEIMEKFEGVASDEAEVISVSGSTVFTDAVPGDGGVTLKGENVVSAIISLPERSPVMIKKSIPFEEVIEVDGAKAEMCAVPSGFVSSADVGLGMDGDSLSVVANIIAEYSVELIANTTVSVVSDAYTVDGDCRNEYADTSFSEVMYAGRKKLSIDVKCDKTEERFSGLCDVISIGAEIRNANAVTEGDFCKITGEITVSGVGYESNIDGSVSYVPVKIQETFSEKVNLDCQITDKTQVECRLSADDFEVSCGGESINVRCLASALVEVYEARDARMLVKSERVEGERKKRDASVITVYYPKDGESLFEVAKRYKTTALKIANDNALSESAAASFDSSDSLVGIKKLIIR